MYDFVILYMDKLVAAKKASHVHSTIYDGLIFN